MHRSIRSEARPRIVSLALLCTASIFVGLAGCQPAGSVRVDPVCGETSGLLSLEGLSLEKASRGPVFLEPIQRRQYELAPAGRQLLGGFLELPLFEKFIDLTGNSESHVETVTGDGLTLYGPELRFAPRIRFDPSDPWTELSWIKLPARKEYGDTVFDVPFDLSGHPTGRGRIEIALSAYASLTPEKHTWQSPPLELSERSVFSAHLRAIPAGRQEGPVVWRIMACEGEACECIHAEVIDAGDERLGHWSQRYVSLQHWAGRSPVIRLETESLNPDRDAVDPGYWADPMLTERLPENAPPRMNLLIISLDTLGADHLGVYGYTRNTSPYIDKVLAPRSTVFMEAAAPATTTGPSHMTLFTSLPPSVHGFVSNLAGQPLPAAVPTLAEILSAAGYLTGAVTENGAITGKAGFSRGFDSYEENRSAKLVVPEGHIEATFEAGRRFIERAGELPWFVFLHSYQVHYPYSPPPNYGRLFAGDGLDPSRTEGLFSEGRRRHHPILYDREVRYTDDQLRIFLTELEEAGRLENTIVVTLSDHGEAFFEHTYLGHGADLHRETLRVPLILAGPGVPAGITIAQNVGLADVMPTVLELLKVPAPPDLMGRSLVPLIKERNTDPFWHRRPIFSEAWHTTGATLQGPVEVDQPTLAVRRGNHKLIRHQEKKDLRQELFDLENDPLEQDDLLRRRGGLTDEQAGLLAELSGLLDDYSEEAARRAARLGVVTDTSPELEIEPDRLEKLRALGYID